LESLSNLEKKVFQIEYKMVENHLLKTKGNYIILAISPDVEKIDEIFENTLK